MLILRCDSLVAMAVKNLPAVQETWVLSLSQEDPLEEEMATHSNMFAWKIHGQKSLVGCSLWDRRVRATERLSTRKYAHGPGRWQRQI